MGWASAIDEKGLQPELDDRELIPVIEYLLQHCEPGIRE